jgi:hypothetical protein
MLAMFREDALPVQALDGDRLTAVVKRVAEFAASVGARRPGTAEILDAFKASLRLGIAPGTPEWTTLTRVLLFKEPGNPDVPKVRP